MLPVHWRNKDSLAGPSFDDFIERFFYGWPTFESDTETAWVPRVDVHETDKEVLIDVELPGIDKKDVKVEIRNNTLKISGERKQEKKTENKEYSCVERHYGKFERSFVLPDTVNADKVLAQHNNGVLTLALPKTEQPKPKEIAVEVK